ncbi:MAG TPA: MFS transporter [Enhygromyxa sp.]|nr:MFS transporter [Enhygromyxa sp.]
MFWGRSAVLRRLADLRPGEAAKVLPAALWFCCLLTTNYTLRPLREAMGVAGGVDQLHWLFTATFLVMLAAVPLYGLAVARLGRARIVPIVHRFFALHLLLFFALMQGWLGDGELVRIWTARVFFVWTSVFNLFVISLFWSVMADLFDGGDARRLFGLISVGGSVGAIAGPALGGLLSWWLAPSVLPLVGVVLLEAAVWAMKASGSSTEREHEQAPVGGGAWSAIPDLLSSPLLLGICAYVLLLTISSTTVYFIQARIIEEAFVDDRTRTSVFAAIDLIVNVTSLITQTILTGRVIRRIGLGLTLATLPCMCLIGLVGLAAAPAFASLVGFQILRRAGDYALARPAREVLYTAVDRSRRYKAKSLIDTVVYRGGDALTGWAFAGLQALGLSLGAVALVVAPLTALWLAVGMWLGRRADADRGPNP